ncbi:MAG: hypothetical protein D8M59_01285 [Planctomycetes bacterium]|nr:hypothetical protein [Planctomycetota bacterium]
MARHVETRVLARTDPQDRSAMLASPPQAGSGSRSEWFPPLPSNTRRSGFGWLRFCLASIRFHPIQFIGTILLISCAGIISLWLRPVAWQATAQLHVPNSIEPVVDMAAAPVEQQRAVLLDLNATDVAELLKSRTLLHSVREAIAQQDPGQASGRLPGAPIRLTLDDADQAGDIGTLATRARDSVRAAWASLRARMRDGAAWFGLTTPIATADDPPAADPDHAGGALVFGIEVHPADRDQNVISFDVWANQPQTARQAADLLVMAVRTQLTTIYQDRAVRRWEQLVPSLEDLSINRAAARTELQQFRAGLEKQNPAAYAKRLEELVADSRARLAALETEKSEIEAQRHSVLGQLNEISLDSQEEIVSADNPRLSELMGEISDLEAEYASKLARYTEKHAEMVQLRSQIDSKKEELSTLQQTVITERVTAPNPVFRDLIRTQMELDQRLNQLAGREMGLARAETELSEELRNTSAVAEQLATLETTAAHLETEWQALKTETGWLRAISDDDFLLADLGLSHPAVVNDPTRPDRPVTSIHLGISAALALFGSLFLCVLRAAWRNRALGRWQVEDLSQRVPLVVVAELPKTSYRRLLRRQAPKALA